MLLMALQTWEILILFLPLMRLVKIKEEVLSVLLAGILAGLFSSLCYTGFSRPAGLGGTGRSLLWGVILLLLYALGHSVLIIAAGTAVGFVQKVSAAADTVSSAV